MYFLQNSDDVLNQILDGKYVLACASLKQEMEMVARGNGILKKEAKHGKSVNILNYPGKRMGVVYGLINDVAHISKDDILHQLITKTKMEEGKSTIFIFPNFSPKLFWSHFALHFSDCAAMASLALNLVGVKALANREDILAARKKLIESFEVFQKLKKPE